MELACLFMLFLLCGLSQQAPKQLTKRNSLKTMTMDKETNPLSMEVENLFSNQVGHRRQNVIELVRKITPAKAEPKLEKHSTIRKVSEITLQDPTNGTKTGDHDNREKHSNIYGSADSEETRDGDSSSDEYQDEDQSREDEKEVTDIPTSTAKDDSVAAFINTGSVSATTRDMVTKDDDQRREKDAEDATNETTASKKDSVSAFINTGSVSGTTRDAITQDDGQSGEEDSEDATSETTPEDSVAAYTNTGPVSATTRDIITQDKISNERDPVASYVEWKSKKERKGSLRDKIEQNKDEDHSETTRHDTRLESQAAVNPNQRDSVASYIRAASSEEKGKISSVSSDSVSAYIEQDDSEKEITRNKLNDNAEPSGSGEHVDDGDSIDRGTISGDSSGVEDEATGEDELHSSKTQAILEGLEEDLSQEGSSSGFHEKLPSEYASQNEKLWRHKSHLNKSQEHSSPYVVFQQPYGVPIQYNMPQYTLPPQYTYVSINNAEKKGAVCLDGSTPGYFYRRGAGNGEKKWIIYLQGGAWCDTEEDCFERSKSNLGSSLKFTYLKNAEGVLSRDEAKNPDFYNWNAVYVPYCDGASYTGNRSHPVVVQGRMLYFRGKRILSALLDDLLAHGLSHSEKVVFSGTSAGGLAVLLNTDYVRSRIPDKVNVYSLADAGVFLDVNDMKGKSPFADSMKAVYELHNSSESINPKCKSHQGKNGAWKCLFPYYFGKYIQSPLFIINPLHDSWQLANVVGIHCAYKPDKCDKEEMKAIKKFRGQTLKALKPFMNNPNVGIFADGCVDHGQIVFSPKWTKIRVKNRSMSGTFVRWMKKEERIKSVIDFQADQYPFNPTCFTLS